MPKILCVDHIMYYSASDGSPWVFNTETRELMAMDKIPKGGWEVLPISVSPSFLDAIEKVEQMPSNLFVIDPQWVRALGLTPEQARESYAKTTGKHGLPLVCSRRLTSFIQEGSFPSDPDIVCANGMADFRSEAWLDRWMGWGGDSVAYAQRSRIDTTDIDIPDGTS